MAWVALKLSISNSINAIKMVILPFVSKYSSVSDDKLMEWQGKLIFMWQKNRPRLAWQDAWRKWSESGLGMPNIYILKVTCGPHLLTPKSSGQGHTGAEWIFLET